jgi:GR25 family glycosyltransferase involved in LPS biosynthesis
MKIFVVHYKKLIERKKHVLEQFKKYNITEYEFIEIDRDELDGYDLSLFENISNAYMAIGLSHIYAFKQIKNNYDQAIIFEDDVILSDNFVKIFNNYMSQLPKDYDMFFFGAGCNLHIQANDLIPNKNIYEKGLYATHWGGDGCTRCLDSYVVSKKCAIKLCDYIDNIKYKINLSTDWWLNIAARDNNFKVYWAEPTIACQGSENGLYVSSYKKG